MNLDATVISVSLVATGVATCILLGNPQMDHRFALDDVGSEKSLLPLAPIANTQDHTHQKLAQLEAEVAGLKEQMEVLINRMAEANQKISRLGSQSTADAEQEVIGYAGHHE